MVVVPADMAFFGPELLLLGFIPILVLFAANYCLNFGIAWLFRKHLKTDGRPSYAALALVTILGLVIDSAAFALSFMLPEAPLIRNAFIGLFVMLGMAATTYWLIFKAELDRKEAFIASLSFGVISNPVWLLFVLVPVY